MSKRSYNNYISDFLFVNRFYTVCKCHIIRSMEKAVMSGDMAAGSTVWLQQLFKELVVILFNDISHLFWRSCHDLKTWFLIEGYRRGILAACVKPRHFTGKLLCQCHSIFYQRSCNPFSCHAGAYHKQMYYHHFIHFAVSFSGNIRIFHWLYLICKDTANDKVFHFIDIQGIGTYRLLRILSGGDTPFWIP